MGSDYDAIQALNWSTLSRLRTSPAYLRWRAEHPEPDTAAYRLGRAVHCALLEPEAWTTRYVAAPKVDRRKPKDKAIWEDFLATSGGAEVLTADEHALAETCARAVREHRVARDLLRGGRAEETVQWTDSETGIECKGRLDYLAPDCLIDLKTTRRTSLRDFVRDVVSYGYHGQVAWYRDGAIAAKLLPPDAEAYIVAVQVVEPYDVIACRLTADADTSDRQDQPGALTVGRALYRTLLRRYAECRAADYWPGIAPDLVTLQLPPWALNDAADEGGDF